MNIQRLPVRKINPAPYNPRVDLKPTDPEYQKLARSIDEFGCVEPLVWNKKTGHLVGGHQRFKILLARGDTHVDVSVVNLDFSNEKALNIALNRIGGDWDQDKLGRLLDELTKCPDLDIALTGFDLPEIDGIIAGVLAGNGEAKPENFDIAGEMLASEKGPAITKPGDLIVLGRDPRLQHRLLCGDSTDPAQVKRLMDGERAVLFATDPPYLVDYDGTNHPSSMGAGSPAMFRARRSDTAKTGGSSSPRSRVGGQNKDWSDTYGVTWDDSDGNPDLYKGFITAAVAEAIRPDAAWYCWHASRRQAMLEEVWNQAGAFVHCQIVWVKNRPVLTRTWYMWQHEPCLMGWMKPPKGKKPPRIERTPTSTVWNVDTLANGADRPDHPTPKPLEVFEIPIRQHTRPGEVCYEPFAGSGSQVIAAQRLGRRCHAIEISPGYCDVIIRRFIAYAGEHAVAPAIAKKYRRPSRAGGVVAA